MAYWFDLISRWAGWFPPTIFIPFLIMYATPPSPNNSEFDKYDEPRLHMERLMRVKLVEFDISLRILIPLEKAGIKTLGDLTSRSVADLKKISQLGVKSIATLERLLDRLDLHLAK